MISYPTALLAKTKGFNIPTENIYLSNKLIVKNGYFPEKHRDDVGVVSQSRLQKWLREKHNLHIVIDKVCNLNNTITFWNYEVCFTNNENILMKKQRGFKSYEIALEKGLQHALNLIK